MKKHLINTIIMLLFASIAANSQDKFTISSERPGDFNGIVKFLGLYPMSPKPIIPFYLRSALPNKPGYYFYSPEGAASIDLSVEEKKVITSMLMTFIDSNYYDAYIIGNLRGFRYRISPEEVDRREYHIRYMQGDTIYVISGWIGKFISFYRAIPATNKPSLAILQDEMKLISPSYDKAPESLFRAESQDSLYFFERVDRERLLMVRGYNINEIESYNKASDIPKIVSFNLIEITKFYNKEAIP
jgi:hypothetical protein